MQARRRSLPVTKVHLWQVQLIQCMHGQQTRLQFMTGPCPNAFLCTIICTAAWQPTHGGLTIHNGERSDESMQLQVNDLRAKLGAAAVPCPATDIGSSFEAIANKALGITGFYPYSSDTNFLLGEPCYSRDPEH